MPLDWVDQDDERFQARCRLSCLHMGRRYDPDRLIAAANMSDILPAAAAPRTMELAPDVADAVGASELAEAGWDLADWIGQGTTMSYS